MTLTPREYLHQHFGPKDRRWIESLTDDRVWEVCMIVGIPLNRHEPHTEELKILARLSKAGAIAAGRTMSAASNRYYDKQWSGDIDQPGEVGEYEN